MTSIKNNYLLLFSFLIKAVLCTLTTTEEPPRRPLITSDNIPPFPGANKTESDTFTLQDSSEASGGTSDEISIVIDNRNIPDEDSAANVEERGSFNHLTKMYPIRSKPVRRQIYGDTPLIGSDEKTASRPKIRFTNQNRRQNSPTNNNRGRLLFQEKYQPSANQDRFRSEQNSKINQQQTTPIGEDKNTFGSVSTLYANNRGRQSNQPLSNHGSVPSEGAPHSPHASNNIYINQQQDISAPIIRNEGILGSVNQLFPNNNRGGQYNQNQRFSNQDSSLSGSHGREKNSFGSVNLQFAPQYNNTPYKSDPVSCNKRGMCNTITQKDLFQNTYKLIEQFSSDQYETTMCFTEIIYVTEIDSSDTLLISREFVWTIETTDHTNTLNDVSCNNFFDTISNPPLELTNTERFEGRVVKEYRRKHCGIGNIFKHEYSSWPSNDRRMIQVTISNSSLLQCPRQQERDSNFEEQLHTTTLNPFIYRTTVDTNMNTYVTEMPKPSSVDQVTSNSGETNDVPRLTVDPRPTPSPPVVAAHRYVEDFDRGDHDDHEESIEQNLNDYMKIIIDCVLKNKNFKGMCPHSPKSLN